MNPEIYRACHLAADKCAEALRDWYPQEEDTVALTIQLTWRGGDWLVDRGITVSSPEEMS